MGAFCSLIFTLGCISTNAESEDGSFFSSRTNVEETEEEL